MPKNKKTYYHIDFTNNIPGHDLKFGVYVKFPSTSIYSIAWILTNAPTSTTVSTKFPTGFGLAFAALEELEEPLDVELCTKWELAEMQGVAYLRKLDELPECRNHVSVANNSPHTVAFGITVGEKLIAFKKQVYSGSTVVFEFPEQPTYWVGILDALEEGEDLTEENIIVEVPICFEEDYNTAKIFASLEEGQMVLDVGFKRRENSKL